VGAAPKTQRGRGAEGAEEGELRGVDVPFPAGGRVWGGGYAPAPSPENF